MPVTALVARADAARGGELPDLRPRAGAHPDPGAGPAERRLRPGEQGPRAARRRRRPTRSSPRPAEIADGLHDDQFPIDVFQTGSGTSSNMNTNEVIAGIAAQNGVTVHPNDDVNMSQSSNDTFPTATHIAATEAAVRHLIPALEVLHEALESQGQPVAHRGQVRPHPPDGRRAGDAGPGVQRVCPPDRGRHRAGEGHAAPAGRTGHRRHRRRHRPQRARRVRRARSSRC